MTASSFRPMLAKDAPLESLTFPVIVQAKLDGIRCSIVNGKPVSRTLKPIPNAEINAALSDPRLEGLDGELIVGSPTADDAYRTTVSFVMAPDKTGEPWAFHVFDKWNTPGSYDARRTDLKLTLLSRGHDRIVDLTAMDYVAVDLDGIEAREADALAEGHEGVIVRTLDANYKFGRSGKKGPLVKVKRFIDFEAEIIDVFEELHNGNERFENELGRGARSSHKANKQGKGTLGGFVLRAINGPHEGTEFRCGTGFSREQRVEWWSENPCANVLLAGKTVKVKSFPIGVKDKPRHPVFLGFRDMEVDG